MYCKALNAGGKGFAGAPLYFKRLHGVHTKCATTRPMTRLMNEHARCVLTFPGEGVQGPYIDLAKFNVAMTSPIMGPLRRRPR